MKQIYVFKNNLTKSFSLPVVSPEQPDTFFRQHHDAVILDFENASKQFIHISTIICIGQYDDATGRLIPFEEEQQLSYNCQEAADQLKALKEQANVGKDN